MAKYLTDEEVFGVSPLAPLSQEAQFNDLSVDEVVGALPKSSPLDRLHVNFPQAAEDSQPKQPVYLSDDELFGVQPEQKGLFSKAADVAGDTARLLGAGTVGTGQTLRELQNIIPDWHPVKIMSKPSRWLQDKLSEAVSGKGVDELLEETYQDLKSGLSEEQKAAAKKDWWDDEAGWFGPAWQDPRAYYGGVVESLPETLLTMGPSAKIATTLAKSAYQAAMTKALASGATQEAAKQVASKAAATAATGAASIAGSAFEGAMGGAGTSREVREQIMSLKPEVLAQSEAVQAMLRENPGMTLDDARNELAENMAALSFVGAGVITSLFGGQGDKAIAAILSSGVPQNVIARIGKGAASEALEEFGQSGGQSVATNLAVGQADPNRGAFDDTLNQMLGGAAAGGIMGGFMGGISSPDDMIRADRAPDNEDNRGATPGNMDDVAAAADNPLSAPMSPDEVLQYAQQRQQELQAKPALETYEQTELDLLQEISNDPDALAETYAINLVRDGVRDQARSSVEPLTPEDEASPIPNELIQSGRQEVADSGAVAAANKLLSDAGLPPVGTILPVRVNGQTVSAEIQDAYSDNGKQGANLRLPDGTTISKSFASMWLEQNDASQPANLDNLIDQQQGYQGPLDYVLNNPEYSPGSPQAPRIEPPQQARQPTEREIAIRQRIEELKRLQAEAANKQPSRQGSGLTEQQKRRRDALKEKLNPQSSQETEVAPDKPVPAGFLDTVVEQQQGREVLDDLMGVQPPTRETTPSQQTQDMQRAGEQLARQSRVKDLRRIREGRDAQKEQAATDSLEPGLQQPENAQATPTNQAESPAITQPEQAAPSVQEPASTGQDEVKGAAASDTAALVDVYADKKGSGYSVITVPAGTKPRSPDRGYTQELVASNVHPEDRSAIQVDAGRKTVPELRYKLARLAKQRQNGSAIAAEAKAESEYSSGLLSEKEQADLEARAKAAAPKVMALTDSQLEQVKKIMGYRGPASRAADRLMQEHPDDIESTLSMVEPENAKSAEQETAQKPSDTTTQIIEDFGEKLEGARKDYASKLADAKEKDIAAVPLSESWPEPDYQKILDSGVDPTVVAYARALRDQAPAKPRKGWKLRGWVERIETLRNVAEGVMDGSIKPENVRNMVKKTGESWGVDMLGAVDLYQEFGHDRSMKGLRFYEAHYSLYDGKKNVNMWVVEKTATSGFGNWPTRLADGATKEEAVAKLKKFFASVKETGKKVRFDIYMSRHDRSDVYIAKKIGQDVVRIKDGFNNVKDAREYLNNNQEELEKILEQKKRIPSHRKETNSPRVGIDHRNGGDVTPEAFAEAFGFRGVQFGNYVEQGKRQQDLNEAYDGLMDLAGIIGVPAKALSLNGELGLAFGARGKGGKNAAAAHYEPGKIVINLTKRSGAGSLAHEWFHALDNYFTRERKASSTGKFATEGDATKSTRPEVAEAIEKIGQTVRKMELYHRSKQLDRTRTKPYWSTTVEMTARSFESYVIEKLRDQGLSNDYLANIASQEYWEAAAALNPEAKSSYPYPEAAEIPEIRAAYDNLFDVIQSKETDAGDVMLFKRGESSGSMTQQDAQSITDEVTAGWSNAPKVNVVQSVDELPKPIYDYAESVGALGDVRVVYWQGEMHFVADRFANRKALEEAILHEGIGHHGIRSLFGKDIEPYLERVYLAMARSDKAKEIKARYFDAKRPFDAGNKKHRMELAEELLAHMAESGKHRNLWNKIVSFIRDALRRMNFTLQINDKDLLAILREAEAVVKGGGISRMEGAPAMSRLPTTIEVNGKQRPTTNSSGKPIHPTEEGVRNFWAWFGESKVVDDQGRPMVVYHGSPDVRGIFNGGFAPSMLRGSVYFASDSYAVADTYADDSRAFDFQSAEPQTVSIYISLKDPLIVDGKGQKWRETERHIKEAKDKGHDGVIIKNTRDEYNNTNTGGRLSGVYAFFKPNQAKSAIDGQLRSRIDRELIDGATGNTGAFSPDTDDIRFRRGGSDADPEIASQAITDRGESLARTLFDKAVFRFQDKFNYLYKAQKKAEAERGAELTEAEDAYLAELRYHGQAGAAIEDFQRDYVDPLVKQVSESGLTIDEVDKYLHARHAPEANAQLAKVNPDREDNQALSGMSNEEAERIIDQFRREGKIAGLHVIGRKVNEITKMRRDLLRSSGLETDDVINKWEETYKHYVPLYREESALARPGKGKGFSVTGKEKRRAGSNRAVTHILAHVVAQYETTAIRAEKNKVAKAMLNFAMNNPNPDLYEVDKVEYQATFDSEGLVVYRPQKEFALADNVMVVKDDGVDRTITFNKYNDQAMKMVYALKNLGAEHSGTIANVLSRVTRYLAVINTGANPEFIISNFVRDLQTAGYNLSSTEADKMKWKIIKDVGKAWRGIRAFQKGNNSEWAQHFDEFRKSGAQTGWLEFYADISAREKKLINSVEDLRDGNSLLKVKRGLKAVWKFIEDENTAVENAIRLSAFVHSRRNGVSVAKSARLAKELTVNFNRKGDYGQVMNSLYLFYNASIQGSVRLLLAAKHKKVQKLIGATVVAAMFLDVINRAIGGDDEDDKPRYDKIPDHVKERNLVIMLPSGSGDYIKIPLPWGYNVFHVMGQVMGEAMTKRGFKPTEGASRVAGSVFGAFNPIGGGTSISQTLSPTIGDPFVQWAENKDWAGRPLRPEGSPFDIDKPMSQKYWNSAREPSRWIAEQLNTLTGGDSVRPGMIDVSPEAIDLAIDFLTGGIGRFAADITLTPAKWAQGETVESYEVPLLRKVYGKPGISTTIQEFHRNKDDVRLAQLQYEHYIDADDKEKAQEVREEYADQLALVRDKKATERAISRIKKEIKRVQNLRISDDDKKSRIDALREQERKLMMRFNKRYNDLIL